MFPGGVGKPRKRRAKQHQLPDPDDLIPLGNPKRANVVPDVQRPLCKAVGEGPVIEEGQLRSRLRSLWEGRNPARELNLIVNAFVARDQSADSNGAVDMSEKLVVLMLELSICARKCPSKHTALIVDVASSLLLRATQRKTDDVWEALAIVAVIDASLRRPVGRRARRVRRVPANLVKSYVCDRVKVRPVWTGLDQCQHVCDEIRRQWMYGCQRAQEHLDTARIDEDLELFVCSKLFQNDFADICSAAGIGNYDGDNVELTYERWIASCATPCRTSQVRQGALVDSPSVEQLNLITECSAFYIVRFLLVFRKLDSWLYDVKVNKYALDIIKCIILNFNIELDTDAIQYKTGLSLMGRLIRIPAKTQAIHMTILASIETFLRSLDHSDRSLAFECLISECIDYLMNLSDGCTYFGGSDEICRRSGLPYAIISSLCNLDEAVASRCLGSSYCDILMKRSNAPLLACSTILRDLLLGDDGCITSPSECVEIIRDEVFCVMKRMFCDVTEQQAGNDLIIIDRMCTLAFANLMFLSLQIMRQYKDIMMESEDRETTQKLGVHDRVIKSMRDEIHSWQIDGLSLLTELALYMASLRLNSDDLAARQDALQACFAIFSLENSQIDQLAISLKEIIIENDCNSVVHVLVNACVNSDLVCTLFQVARCTSFDRLRSLEIIEQVVRRCIGSIDSGYGSCLFIDNVNNLLEQVWFCCYCVTAPRDEPNENIVDEVCFWRCCYILTFLVCISKLIDDTGKENVPELFLLRDSACEEILRQFPTVHLMVDMVISNQFTNKPELTLVRLCDGDEDVFDERCKHISLWESEECTSVSDTCVANKDRCFSKVACLRWPRMLSEIQLSKLKALNHSHRLCDRLLSEKALLIRGIFADLLVLDKANSAAFCDLLLNDWVNVVLSFDDIVERLPVHCLFLTLFNDTKARSDDKKSLYERNRALELITRITVCKINASEVCSWEVVELFFAYLAKESLSRKSKDIAWGQMMSLNQRQLGEMGEGCGMCLNRFGSLSDGFLAQKVSLDQANGVTNNLMSVLAKEVVSHRGKSMVIFAIDLCSRHTSVSASFASFLWGQVRKRKHFYRFMDLPSLLNWEQIKNGFERIGLSCTDNEVFVATGADVTMETVCSAHKAHLLKRDTEPDLAATMSDSCAPAKCIDVVMDGDGSSCPDDDAMVKSDKKLDDVDIRNEYVYSRDVDLRAWACNEPASANVPSNDHQHLTDVKRALYELQAQVELKWSKDLSEFQQHINSSISFVNNAFAKMDEYVVGEILEQFFATCDRKCRFLLEQRLVSNLKPSHAQPVRCLNYLSGSELPALRSERRQLELDSSGVDAGMQARKSLMVAGKRSASWGILLHGRWVSLSQRMLLYLIVLNKVITDASMGWSRNMLLGRIVCLCDELIALASFCGIKQLRYLKRILDVIASDPTHKWHLHKITRFQQLRQTVSNLIDLADCATETSAETDVRYSSSFHVDHAELTLYKADNGGGGGGGGCALMASDGGLVVDDNCECSRLELPTRVGLGRIYERAAANLVFLSHVLPNAVRAFCCTHHTSTDEGLPAAAAAAAMNEQQTLELINVFLDNHSCKPESLCQLILPSLGFFDMPYRRH